MQQVLTFAEWAKAEGWKVELQAHEVQLPPAIRKRFPQIPHDVVGFISQVKTCVRKDDTAWMLCVEDFVRNEGFRWDEFERLSLDAASDDVEWQGRITSFWNDHLPVVISCKGEYCYFAVRLKDGVVVRGDEPEFEETTEVAKSFGALLEAISKGTIVIP